MISQHEINSIAQNVGIPGFMVHAIASYNKSFQADSITSLCISRKYSELLIIFDHDENKACFWSKTDVPLEQFKDEQIRITEDEISKLQKITKEKPEVLRWYFKDIPTGKGEVYIKYCLFARKETLLELGFSLEDAAKLADKPGPMDEKILKNLHPSQSSVDKLVADIKAIQYPKGFCDFFLRLIGVFQRPDSVQVITRDENYYQGLNRSLVYFWDDIALLYEKSAVCATRLAILFQVDQTENDMKEREYMRSVLDVCHSRKDTDWEHINKYLTAHGDLQE
jgi:hypothetical protein